MVKGIIVGAAGVLLAAILGAYVFIVMGRMPANADAKPSRLERWAARTSLRAAIERRRPRGDNPVALTDDNLIAGIKLYAANCAVCHGASDAAASNIAKGLYQKAPQLNRHGVEDDPDGETYWKVYHGIRMTGMPSFGATLTQEQIWRIALFLKHMDALPPKAEKAWKAVPSQAPAS